MLYFHLKQNLQHTYETGGFSNCTKNEAIRYLRGVYSSKDKFLSDFISDMEHPLLEDLKDFFIQSFDDATPFTYEEAFALVNREFQSLVFCTIDITEMVENLGKTQIKVDGIPVKRKQFAPDGEFVGYKEYDNIYETYEVSGEKLGVEENLYVVKCWCTSTNKEHWLWIEEAYKDEPLDAIASTFRIHKNVIPHIKELKRQGDIMIVEMKEEVTPEGEVVPLTKEQYFNLLTTET